MRKCWQDDEISGSYESSSIPAAAPEDEQESSVCDNVIRYPGSDRI